MNRGLAENDLRRGLEDLLGTIEREQAPRGIDPYAGAGDQVLHEHDTRVLFIDKLLVLLGWSLGAAGDVLEEVRIKSETTKFIDYVGVNPETSAPALIFEAKGWSKPLVSAREASAERPPADLVIAAVKHIHAGGPKDQSPVSGEWHDYLVQVSGYVRTSKQKYEHDVPRAVLSSGQWLLVFMAPARAFCEGQLGLDDLLLLESKDYVAKAHLIHGALSRVAIADTAPTRLRSSELANYVSAASFRAAYHALLVWYEKSGSPMFTRVPRILLYPALIVERDDGAQFNVIDTEVPLPLPLARGRDDAREMSRHFVDLAAGAQALLDDCSAALEFEIKPAGLLQCPGFPQPSLLRASGLGLGAEHKIFVRPMRDAADHWLVITGDRCHYLLSEPTVECRFHAWVACHGAASAIDNHAVNTPRTDSPRAFFIDAALHHCANRVLDDRRKSLCLIRPIDARTCCKACGFHDVCWPDVKASRLPCGG